MDLLYQRYASPFSFIEGMILTGRFSEFVTDFIHTTNQETEDKNKEKEMQFHWELWLHRIFDKGFKDYMDEIKNTQNDQKMSDGTIETTIQNSMNILNNFNPEKDGDS